MKPPRLYGVRYNTAGTTMLEFLPEIMDLGIRWSLPFGFQRAEVTVRNRGGFEGYARYWKHHSQRFLIIDSYLDRPVADGWVYEVRLDGAFVTYVIGGPVWRHREKYYQQSDLPASGDTDAVVKDILTDKVSAVGSDQSNIGATGTDMGTWEPERDGGELPVDIIPHLLLMSDSDGDIWDYWIQATPLNGVVPQDPVAYMDERSTSSDADWSITREDMAADRARMATNIWQLYRKVTVYYGRVTGTHDGNPNSNDFVDTSENWADAGANVGDTILNITDGSRGVITSIGTTTNPGDTIVTELSGGTDDDFDVGDSVVVELDRPASVATAATSSETDYWGSQVPEFISHQRNMDATQAGQFAKLLLGQYEKIVQRLAFVLTSPFIKAASGARVPLWDPIKRGGGYLRTDFFPASSVLSTSLDNLTAVRIVAMDYNFRSNRLRVVPDTEDSRLDAILKRGRLVMGEQIQA